MKSVKAGEILKKAREAKGHTQEEFAKTIHLTARMLQRYEDGEFPKYKTEKIKEIDKLLNTTLHEIIYDNNFREAKESETQIQAPEPDKKQNYSVIDLQADLINQLKKYQDLSDKYSAILEEKLKNKDTNSEDIIKRLQTIDAQQKALVLWAAQHWHESSWDEVLRSVNKYDIFLGEEEAAAARRGMQKADTVSSRT